MRRYLLAIAVILTAATGCDNVSWGGIDVEIVHPQSTPEAAAEEATVPGEAGTPRVAGPVLLAGVREGSRATLTVVGEVQGDAVAAFPDTTSPEDVERLAALTAAGSRWILFSEGVRVGSMTADASGVAQDFCGPRATISGVVELVPPASTAERLLALPAATADREYQPFRALAHVYDQRVASLTLAGEAIPRFGANWPAGSLLEARQDIQAFQMVGTAGTSIAATFMYEDQLAVVPPGPRAYALFVLGVESGDTYREAYAWYREVDTDGKGAPRYFSHLDWDGDGSAEILLDVFGSDRRWFAGLAQRGGQWIRTFQGTCASGSSAGD